MSNQICLTIANRILVAIVAFAPRLAACTAEETATLRIMTYNVHHCEGTDGKLDVERIAKVITDQQCDLVALQELDRHTARSESMDQIAQLAKLTGLTGCFGKAIDFGGGEYGVGVLSRLPIIERRTIKLPSGERREQRVALEIVVKPANSPEFTFVSTHFDHSSGENDRARQAASLRELFGANSRDSILAGDFNAPATRAEMAPLLEKWMDVDAKKQSPTIPAAKPTLKIDYILLPQSGPWEVVSTEVLNEPIASDHLPLVTTIRTKQ